MQPRVARTVRSTYCVSGQQVALLHGKQPRKVGIHLELLSGPVNASMRCVGNPDCTAPKANRSTSMLTVVYRLPNLEICAGLSSGKCCRVLSRFDCVANTCATAIVSRNPVTLVRALLHRLLESTHNHNVATKYGSEDVQGSCRWCASSTSKTICLSRVADTNMISYHICISCPSTTIRCWPTLRSNRLCNSF